jgi:DNA-binding MarR family transcriptional regulator
MSSDKHTPPEIDKTIHEPARLLIMAHLYIVEEADFTYLMRQTDLTWGNLSSHMSKLEDAGYINVEKTFKAKRPNTMLRLTEAGRTAFKEYRQQILGVLGNTAE